MISGSELNIFKNALRLVCLEVLDECRWGQVTVGLAVAPLTYSYPQPQTRSKDRIARGVSCKYFAMGHTEAKDTQKKRHVCVLCKHLYVWC